MNTIISIERICRRFLSKQLDLFEFQGWLETAEIDDNISRIVENPLKDALNRLEEIQFSYKPENYYLQGQQVAHDLLEKIKSLKDKN
jgi:hypothetical protein